MSLKTDALFKVLFISFQGVFYCQSFSSRDKADPVGQIFIGQFVVDNKSLESNVS